MSKGGMQLTPEYRGKLFPKFLSWYFKVFTNKERMCYGHWSATGRCSDDAAYHIEIQQCPKKGAHITSHEDTTKDLYSHTWQRNGNSWAICIASMAGATTEDLGQSSATPDQLRLFIDYTAKGLINNHTPVSSCMTHAEAADNWDDYDGHEPYGPFNGCERWDWWVWINPTTLELKPAFKNGQPLYPEECPKGLEYFGDWWRGQSALKIQEITSCKWK